MLVDSHCHLDLLDLHSFSGGLVGVIDAAREQGVTHLLCVAINLENYPRMLSLVEGCAEVSVSVGVHPNERGGREPAPGELVDHAAHPRVVAIGETGLDYFRSEGELEWQRERFRNHIRAAKQAGKPLIVHSRDAKEDTLAILREEDAGEAGGVMHCFTGDWEMAKRAMDLNFYISFSGIVTFNSARELMEVARRMPVERMLVETDCPYLAPAPHRGKKNEPMHVAVTGRRLAELKGLPVEEVAAATSAAAVAVFKLD